jgi:hypothetical protein
MTNDTAITRLLYAILSQKCLKDVRPPYRSSYLPTNRALPRSTGTK